MAADYRRIVRTKLVEALRTQFRVVNDATAAEYGVPPLRIDFTHPSRNFVQAYVDPLGFDGTVAAIDLPGVVCYTSEAVDEKRQTNCRFSGFVAAHLDFYLRYRAIRDYQGPANQITERQAAYEPEVLADCVEDSALATLRGESARAIFQTAGVSLTEYKAERDPIDQSGDGFSQRVALTLGFIVHVR